MNADVAQMDTDMERERLNSISKAIIGAAQRVSSTVGYVLEKVYENALVFELRTRSISVDQQRPIHVYFQGQVVGDYVPDLFVEDSVIVEIKAIPDLGPIHRQQCLNYLRATDLKLALLLNFGRARLEVSRVVWHF